MRVLIVDDEQAMLKVMKRLLEKIAGIEIAGQFRNAEEALALVEREEVDIAFVDIMIAGDSGLELARRMRAAQSKLEIVFVTSHSDFAYESFDAYPLDYMVKPVSAKRLEQTIARAKARRSANSTAVQAVAATAEASNKLKVCGLGGMDVSSATAGNVKWRSKKSMELLAYLLVHRERSVSQSRIIEDLFPDRTLKSAKDYLNTAMYQLRNVLQQHELKAEIVYANEQYRLQVEQIDADFIAFESYVAGVKHIDRSNIEAALEWEAKYTGDLFEDKIYIWATAEQARLAELYGQFAKRLIRWLLASGQSEHGIRIAKKLVERNEWDEEAHTLIMQLYGQLSDKWSLQKHYARITDMYREELNIPVSDNLSELYKRLV
jgi:two-component SAPR family response regulator